jgi:hypothetical protein
MRKPIAATGQSCGAGLTDPDSRVLPLASWLCWTLIAVTMLADGPHAAAAGDQPPLTAAQIRADVEVLRTQWAPSDKSFNEDQRRAFDQALMDMSSRPHRSLADFALDVMRAVAIPRNGHTVAMVGGLLGDLPVRAWWFADGLYIVSVQPPFADLVGARVDKLAALTPDEALIRVAPYISGTDQRIRYLSATYLTSPAILRRIGAVDEAAPIPLSLRLRDGSIRVVTLEPAVTPDPGDQHQPVMSGYSVLIPDDVDLPGRWLHILDGVAARPSAYATPTNLSIAWLGENATVPYIRSNGIVDVNQARFEDKVIGVLQEAFVRRRPRFAIIDLRMNNGGDFLKTILFAQAVPRLMPVHGRIFILIGRGTFSAALVTAAILKGAGRERVTLIGEPMGDGGHFWAEGATVMLPNSHIAVRYSTKFEDVEQGCEDLDRCFWGAVAFGPRGVSLDPEIRIDNSFADYAAGRDPVLEKALSLAR